MQMKKVGLATVATILIIVTIITVCVGLRGCSRSSQNIRTSDESDLNEKAYDQSSSDEETLGENSRNKHTNVHNDSNDNSSAKSTINENDSDHDLFDKEKTCMVTFVQPGYDNVVKKVKKGGTLKDIPNAQAKKGYTVDWESKDLTNITKDITVNAIETANEYTITYIVDYDKATMTTNTQSVTFDEPFTLAIPTIAPDDDYRFVKWIITGTNTEFKNGKYNLDSNVSLTAVWEDKYSKYY